MAAEPVLVDALTRILEGTGLPEARWDYIPDGGWMEVSLPGSEECAGVAEPFGDDLEICFDVETGEPLSIIIPGFPGWLAEQQGKPAPAPQAPIDYDTARKYLARRLRECPAADHDSVACRSCLPFLPYTTHCPILLAIKPINGGSPRVQSRERGPAAGDVAGAAERWGTRWGAKATGRRCALAGRPDSLHRCGRRSVSIGAYRAASGWLSLPRRVGRRRCW